MAWRKVGQGGNDLIDLKEKVGKSITGVYQNFRLIESTGSNIHTISINGENKDFWGSGLLDYLLKQVKSGQNVRITYNGTEKVKVNIKGKNVTKDVHQYSVEVEE